MTRFLIRSETDSRTLWWSSRVLLLTDDLVQVIVNKNTAFECMTVVNLLQVTSTFDQMLASASSMIYLYLCLQHLTQ